MKYEGNLQAHAHIADDFHRMIKLLFWRFHEGKREVYRADVFDTIEPSVYAVDSQYGFMLDKTAAQQLMDDLWKCGIRPTEGEGSAGAMAAAQENIRSLHNINSWLMNQLAKFIDVNTIYRPIEPTHELSKLKSE